MAGVLTRMVGLTPAAAAATGLTASGVGGSYGTYTLSNFNLTATYASTQVGAKHVTYRSSGKYYFEMQTNGVGVSDGFLVWGLATSAISNAAGVFPATTTSVIALSGNSNMYTNFTVQCTPGAPTNGGYVCVAVDLTAQLLWIRVNGGNWNGSGTANPATAAGGISIATILGIGAIAPFVGAGSATSFVTICNFGGSAFNQTVPSGFTSGWP